jgi:hypothetical protein
LDGDTELRIGGDEKSTAPETPTEASVRRCCDGPDENVAEEPLVVTIDLDNISFI